MGHAASNLKQTRRNIPQIANFSSGSTLDTGFRYREGDQATRRARESHQTGAAERPRPSTPLRASPRRLSTAGEEPPRSPCLGKTPPLLVTGEGSGQPSDDWRRPGRVYTRRLSCSRASPLGVETLSGRTRRRARLSFSWRSGPTKGDTVIGLLAVQAFIWGFAGIVAVLSIRRDRRKSSA